MDKNIQLELYTRPTCSDCQESKRYLNSQEISYSHKDVSQNLDLEEEMKKISGNRIVPLFVFYKKFFGVKKSCLNITWDLKITKKDILNILE
ncbi:glutaredoxin family protein [Staphylococcus epidermidis]